jgi:hypothetical protein
MSRPTNLRRLPYGYERFDVDSFGDGLRTLELLSAIGLELSRPLASELRRSFFAPKLAEPPQRPSLAAEAEPPGRWRTDCH